MGIPLKDKCKKYFSELLTVSRAPAKIDETNIYQEANPDVQKLMYTLLEETVLPDSSVKNIEHFKAFYDAVVHGGKSGLILAEHYTNLDLPAIFYLLNKNGGDWGKDLTNHIVAIAGLKLNEENPLVRAWAEGFTRVVIYPGSSLRKALSELHTETEKVEETKRARRINLGAMRVMDDCKKRGQAILVFPSGTRYRPGHPETKRGLKEIDSYVRMFDVMLLVSINGNCLRINPDHPNDMAMDLVERDTITITASPVIECADFRKNVLAEMSETDGDRHQKVIDRIMSILDEQHDAAERARQETN